MEICSAADFTGVTSDISNSMPYAVINDTNDLNAINALNLPR